jgi:hypothetical protein
MPSSPCACLAEPQHVAGRTTNGDDAGLDLAVLERGDGGFAINIHVSATISSG